MQLPDPSGVVTLLSDFGLEDHYVGAMKGVIRSIFPGAVIEDLTHGVEPQVVEQAAFFLEQAYRCYPAGTVHVAVVDPGVGTERRALAAALGEHLFVAPDNGLLSHVLEREPESEILELDADRWGLTPRSATFHGRDVFAPAGAWLASGKPIAEMGEPLEDPVLLPSTEPESAGPGRWLGQVLNIDRFGNIVTSFPSRLLDESGDRFLLTIGEAAVGRLAQSYEEFDDEDLFVIAGSAGRLEVSAKQASAAELADAWFGDEAAFEIG